MSDPVTLWDGNQKVEKGEWQMNGSLLEATRTQTGTFDVYIDGQKSDPADSSERFKIDVKDAKTHDIAIVFEDEEGILSVSSWRVKGKKERHLWPYAGVMGGVLLALDFMRRIHAWRLRNRHHDADLLDTEILEAAGKADQPGNSCSN